MNISAIIFDLGGVLLDIDYNRTKTAFENLGITNFDQMYSQKDADPLFRKLETGKIDEKEFYKLMKKYVPDTVNEEQIREAWNAMLLDFRIESLETLKRLKKKYKLFLLSNTNDIHHQAFMKIYSKILTDTQFDHLFDKVYFSHQLGLRKPDVEPYEYVIRENDLAASETLFIDDSLQNVEAARKAGLQGLHLKEGMKIEDLDL